MKRIISTSIEPYGKSKSTIRLLEMIRDDVISAESCLIDLLGYLPQSTVDEFARDYLDLDDEEYESPVSKDSPLGKFLVKVMEHERSFMDEDDGVETDRYLWSRRVLSGEVAVDDMIKYFKKYYSEYESDFIERLESAASADEDH